MHDQQVSPSRPAQVAPNVRSSNLPKSSAALYGATSAFIPKPPEPTVSQTAISAGARLAASAAGFQAQRRKQYASHSIEQERARNAVSRALDIQTHTPSTGEMRSISSQGADNHLFTPPLLRSSSTLAAQRASAQSISPHRTSEKNPKYNSTASSFSKQSENHGNNLLGSSSTVVPVAPKQHLKTASIKPPEHVKERGFTFEKSSSPSGAGVSTSALAKDIHFKVAMEGDQSPQRISDQIIPIFSDEILRKDAMKGETIAVTISSLGTSRRSSAVSATNSDTAATESLHKSIDVTGHEYLRTLGGRSGRTRIPAKASWKNDLHHQDEYRNVMTVNALADAMVASSLASSRAASPAKKSPPPPPRRRSRSVAALYDLQSMSERAVKEKAKRKPHVMKHTLRKQALSDDEEVELAKRGRRHWVRKHPHKHAEGNRKRWRDKVTELERKRYEGIFAANRGLLVGSDSSEPTLGTSPYNVAMEQRVVNLVVRDIWERSRLPRDVLRDVYDLVSPEEELSLSREQFVVGLWLIDQRLKGRKLPVKVSPSVWDSVRHSQGIKIRRQLL